MKQRIKQTKSWTLLFQYARDYRRATWEKRMHRPAYHAATAKEFAAMVWNLHPLTFSPNIQLPNSMEELQELDPELYAAMTARSKGKIPVEVTLGFGNLETYYDARLPIKVVSTTVPKVSAAHGWFHVADTDHRASDTIWLKIFAKRFLAADAFNLSYTHTFKATIYYKADAEMETIFQAGDIKIAYLYHRYITILNKIINSNLEAGDIRGVCRDLGIKIPVKLPAPDQYDWFAQEIFDGKYSNKQLHEIKDSFEALRDALRPSITSVLAGLA